MYVYITYNRNSEEYVVPCADGDRKRNYHTSDREDAFDTAKKMWASSVNDVFFRVRQIPKDAGDCDVFGQ